MSETDEFRKQIEQQMHEMERRLLGDTLVTGRTNTVASEPAELNVDTLKELHEQLGQAVRHINNIMLIGRYEDTAVLRRLIEDTSGYFPPKIREARYNSGPDKLVLMVVGDFSPSFSVLQWDRQWRTQPQIIKVYLESAEETFRRWKAAGEDLGQLIQRLEAANKS